jgi:hypothetical protein
MDHYTGRSLAASNAAERHGFPMPTLSYQTPADARAGRDGPPESPPSSAVELDPHGLWRVPQPGGSAPVFDWRRAVAILAGKVALAAVIAVVSLLIVQPLGFWHHHASGLGGVVALFLWVPTLGISVPVLIGVGWQVTRAYRSGPWLRRDGDIAHVVLAGRPMVLPTASLAWSTSLEQRRDEGRIAHRGLVWLTLAPDRRFIVTSRFGPAAGDVVGRLAAELARFTAG